MARKRFGQHFLHDPAIIQRLVDVIDPRPEEQIIEIGPGRGALTLPLLERCKRLTAVELDRDLIDSLQARCRTVGTLDLHQADALKTDYAALASGRPVRLVGNLPYNISTPLLFHLLGSEADIVDMHFMLQKEVVERLTAVPGSRDYGRLSVTTNAQAQAEPLFDVGRGAFEPPPQVSSAVARIKPRLAPFELCSLPAFEQVVTQAFSKRRKTLRNALAGLVNEAAIREAGVDPGLRPERITPAQFAALANHLTRQGSSD